MQYLILLVIFNLKLSESSSILSLAKSRESISKSKSKIILWDNSNTHSSDKELIIVRNLLSPVTVEYKHTPENYPLSKIYNITRTSHANENYQYIILLDQDSNFDDNLFKSHIYALNEYKESKLYLPTVKYKEKIISPAHLFLFKGSLFKKKHIGYLNSKSKTAINSCMIIDFHYFCRIFKGYDERLKFYGTDDYFMKSYQKNNAFFIVLDYEIEHDLTFSFMNKDTERLFSRYKEANLALKINNNPKNHLITNFILNLYLIIRGLFLTIKFKDIRFIYDI